MFSTAAEYTHARAQILNERNATVGREHNATLHRFEVSIAWLNTKTH